MDVTKSGNYHYHYLNSLSQSELEKIETEPEGAAERPQEQVQAPYEQEPILSSPVKMNPTASSRLAKLDIVPPDAIFRVKQAFTSDTRPNKIDLSVGVYYDKHGKIPILKCVKEAESKISNAETPHNYLPIDGSPTYNKLVQKLVFGVTSNALLEERVVTAQTVGGTNALASGALLLKKHIALPTAEVWISAPSWENHRTLFEAAGFVVSEYPYFDAATHGVNFNAMLNRFKEMPTGSIALLHACCHNPTGADLTYDQWTEIIDVVQERGLIPFLDMAYQGFGDNLEKDGEVVRRFADTGILVFVANSFSKSFSLYNERVGALSIVAPNKKEANVALSLLKATVIRPINSNPPAHGAQIVETVLSDPNLRGQWECELSTMRERIHTMRKLLVAKLKKEAPAHDFSFILNQRGMFSYTGLTKDQVAKLSEKHAIYAIDSGRICIAALNEDNIDDVVHAICDVLN